MGLRVLLDTHALLWSVFEPEKLSTLARELILNPNTNVLVSPASIWEIATKVRIGKLDHAKAILSSLDEVLNTLVARELPISIEHASVAGLYAQIHKDPFDRMLAAQAEVEQISLISHDSRFLDFSITTIW